MIAYQIKNAKQLEKITGIKVSEERKINLVIKRYPVKLTQHLLKLIRKSEAIRKQFIPTVLELDSEGITRPWEGKINTGIFGLERMYKDRCIIMPVAQCPAYCRHCVRKDYIKRFRRAMSYEEIDKALEYIKKHEEIKEVLITGGDPLMDLKRLEYIISGLRKIDHVDVIRIGTRSIMYDPERISEELISMLKRYNFPEEGKPIEISPQFNHPDELTKESIEACRKLIRAGIKLYNQTVLLKGINDNPKILAKLFRKLRNIGVELHYLYHCAPVEGVKHFRTSIQKGIEIKRWFRGGNLSGRCNPQYIVLLPVGKWEPLIDGEILGKKEGYVIIKSPYRMEDFKRIDPAFKLPEGCYLDKEGFIICEYLDGEQE